MVGGLKSTVRVEDPGRERVIGCHSVGLAWAGVCAEECYTLLSAPAHKELTLDLGGNVGGESVREVFEQVGVEGRDSEKLRFRVF